MTSILAQLTMIHKVGQNDAICLCVGLDGYRVTQIVTAAHRDLFVILRAQTY